MTDACTHRDGYEHNPEYDCPYNDTIRRVIAARNRALTSVGILGFNAGLLVMHLIERAAQ